MFKKWWHRLFLVDRPSLGLSFFRVFVALTTGLHVLPFFLHLEENFLSSSVKVLNTNFFTVEFLELIQKSPDGLVFAFVGLFCVSWAFFLVGFKTQVSCIVMTMCCYYFYALNSFQIGTLSWDVLLVTLFLMCLTSYPGDYFSIDAFFRDHPQPYKKLRPFFIQRLLQMQIAFTFFYSALSKVSAQGNWISENPIYYLMNYPPPGVVKHFMFKEWLSVHPEICYAIGLAVVIFEFALGVLLFIPKMRISAIYLGMMFHILLLLTLDVPAIFFFLFPAQLLLFVNPEKILLWLKSYREYFRYLPRSKVVYDGKCGFCLRCVHCLKVMDMFDVLEFVDFHAVEDVKSIHPELTDELVRSQLYFVDKRVKYMENRLYAGFYAFRRLCFLLPMMYPLIPIVYFPGSGIFGPAVYRWIANHRYLFHSNKVCREGSCAIKSP